MKIFLLPDLEVRSAEFMGVHRQNVYNVTVTEISGKETGRLTADALSADEFATYVENLKKRLDTLVAKARNADAKL